MWPINTEDSSNSHCKVTQPYVRPIQKVYGGFPLSRNFYVRAHVSFTNENKLKVMYEKPHENVKVEWSSTFTLTCDLPDIALYFVHARKIYVRTQIKIIWQWKSTLKEILEA